MGRPVWLECGGLGETRLENLPKATKQGIVELRKGYHGNHETTCNSDSSALQLREVFPSFCVGKKPL